MARVTKKDVKDTGGARWNRQIAKGTYRAKIVDAKVCDRHKDVDCEVAVFRVDGDDESCPEGPVKVDWHCDQGWKTRNFLAIMDPDKLDEINALDDDDDEGVEYNMEDYNGEVCRVLIGHWTGDDEQERASINKLLPLEEKDEEATEARWKAKKGKKKPKRDEPEEDEEPPPRKARRDRDEENGKSRRARDEDDDRPAKVHKGEVVDDEDDDSIPF